MNYISVVGSITNILDFFDQIILLRRIITGLFGFFILSAITWAVPKLIKKIKNSIIESKHPIEGEYKGFIYEDEEDGTTEEKAHIEIEQKGNKISGESRVLSTPKGRESRLEGEISEDDIHIYGRYTVESKSKYDKGTFFLKMQSKILDGFWAGYLYNNEMGSGEYRLKPILPVNCRKAEKKDISGIIRISETVFPAVSEDIDSIMHQYLTVQNNILEKYADKMKIIFGHNQYNQGFTIVAQKKLEKDFLNNIEIFSNILRINNIFDSRSVIGGKQIKNDIIVGFAFCRYIESSECKEKLPIPNHEIPKRFEYVENVGVIDLIGVDPEHQNRGVATKIVSKCLDTFRKRNVKYAVVIVGKESSAESVFRTKNGFEEEKCVEKDAFKENISFSEYYRQKNQLNILIAKIN